MFPFGLKELILKYFEMVRRGSFINTVIPEFERKLLTLVAHPKSVCVCESCLNSKYTILSKASDEKRMLAFNLVVIGNWTTPYSGEDTFRVMCITHQREGRCNCLSMT